MLQDVDDCCFGRFALSSLPVVSTEDTQETRASGRSQGRCYSQPTARRAWSAVVAGVADGQGAQPIEDFAAEVSERPPTREPVAGDDALAGLLTDVVDVQLEQVGYVFGREHLVVVAHSEQPMPGKEAWRRLAEASAGHAGERVEAEEAEQGDGRRVEVVNTGVASAPTSTGGGKTCG